MTGLRERQAMGFLEGAEQRIVIVTFTQVL
jgi:hypothetical protein